MHSLEMTWYSGWDRCFRGGKAAYKPACEQRERFPQSLECGWCRSGVSLPRPQLPHSHLFVVKPEAPPHVTLGITNSPFCLVSKEPSDTEGGKGGASWEKLPHRSPRGRP